MQVIYTNLGFFVLLVSSFIDITISEPRVVCYYTNWSVYRPGTAKFNPQNINPYLCTHLVYAFGGFTKDNQLKPFDKYQDIEQGGYAKFTGLKTYNKELKTMLAIGGWNEGSTRFSPLVASTDRRSQLVKNTIKFLRQNKFDGLDLDWEYPAFRDGGKAKDRENYAKLVQELREEFDREHQKTGRSRLLLTMAVPAGFEYIDKGYDVPKLNKYLDWFNLLTYDFHSAYEPSVNHHAPLYPIEEENEYSFDNDLNINATINYYLKNGAERDKLVLGIPTYGRSYTLFNPESNEIGAPADGPGDQGDATKEKGYLAYYEICQSLKEEDSEWTVVQPNPDALGPYAYRDNQWVGYDDEDIVRRKSEFVVEQKLGGIMFWSIDNDDFRGLCNGKPYPLIEAAKESYLDGLENGVQRKSQYDLNKRKQTTTTKKPDNKKSAYGKSTTPPPPTTPSSGSDFKCEEEGFYPHPSDCTKYFWCLEAPGLGIVAHHFSCPSGLVFNKAADSCDYARNVYCTNKTPKPTTTTTTERTTTLKATTTERVVYNKVSSIYKNPSRTTARTTTTTSAPIETDSSDLEQEDPKVIKELIELIKKAGGIEELEKQINIQEESSSAKSDPKATTPSTASTINKSLVDKIRNRASLFKTRPPLFNGASQPERTTEQKVIEQKTQTEKVSIVSNKEEKQPFTPKKYNAINRFSRPEPQNSGIDKIPESDAILIEKPQYTSILRRKPTKPDVIVENDYNNDSDRTSEEESKSSGDSEVTRKYTSISRNRKPQEKIPVENEEEESEDDREEEEEEQTTAKTTKSTVNKYVNLSRRRSTTPVPEENVDITTQLLTQATRSTIPPRRKVITTEAKTTPKTVLEINTNNESQTLSRKNTLENTLSKNTATNIERKTLIYNKHIHEDDDINHLALPTESVTETILLPDSVTTTQILNTIPPQINANDDKVNDSFNEILDGITESSDIDITTVNNEYIIDDGSNNNNSENGLSEQNIDDSRDSKKEFIVPRPFTRPKLFQNTSPSPLPSRNFVSRVSTEISKDTTRTARRRPTRTFSTTSAPLEDDSLPKPRITYSYRPGYRGTARFRVSTARTGEYEHDSLAGRYQFVDDNRLRALNIDRGNKRLNTITSTTERISPVERPTRRRPAITRTQATSTATPEADEETTTEQRILDVASGRFSLDGKERPDRLKFSLSTGGKINFGFNTLNSKKKSDSTDSNSKPKVITGNLNKSPISFSARELKQGHVEEIPIQASPETVTIKNFSDKLDLSEIPIDESEIKKFVSDDELKTDVPELDDTTVATTRRRLRPSIIGIKKRPEENEESSTIAAIDAEVDSTTEKVLQRNRFSLRREKFQQRTQTKLQSNNEDDSSQTLNRHLVSERFKSRENRLRLNINQESVREFPRKSQLNFDSNSEVESSSPRGFRNRYERTRVPKITDDNVKISTDSTTAKYLTKVKASELFSRNRQINIVEDNENSETQDAPEESTLRTFLKSVRNQILDDQENTTADLDVLDLITEKSEASDEENEIDYTTAGIDENGITENPLHETTVRIPYRKVAVRKKPKKIDSLAPRQTITEQVNDAGVTPEVESTSSITLTTEDIEDIDDYETKIEVASEHENIDTTSTRTPARRIVSRKRINTDRSSTSTANDLIQEEKVSTQETSTTPKTTRRRIITIRTKNGAIKSSVEVGNYEKTETSTEPSASTAADGETDVIRKRIKVYRSRATTERITEESSTRKPTVTRSRVFKRPYIIKEELSDVSENIQGETSSSERSRYTQKTQFRRPVSTTEETLEISEGNEGEISSSERTRYTQRNQFRQSVATTEETEVSDGNEGENSTSERTRFAQRKVIKRPISTKEESTNVSEGEEQIPERNRYTTRRRLVKLTRKPFISEPVEDEQQPNDDIVSESSTVEPRKSGVTRKVLKAKTPKLLVDKPLEEDSLVINSDDENQEVENIEEKREEKETEENIEIENQEISSEEPSSPNIKYPTRPAGRLTITTRKRLQFAPGFRTSTVHPASTRFPKDGNLGIRAKKITTRRFGRPNQSGQESAVDQEKPIALGERNKKIYKTYRKTTATTSTTTSPNITPHNNIDIETETNEYEEVIDTTDNPQITNNNDILQTIRPRFPLSRFTTSTTSKPTTLHHVFAIDIEEEDMNKLKNADLPENQADEVIKKLQKLIEINRIVEVYSKEEKLKLLKNKKLKSIKAGELTLEKPPALDKFGEITRQVIIKLSVKPNITTALNVTTEQPDDARSPKNIMFSETVFGKAETSTISLEGLFEREKKELELNKEEKKVETLGVEETKHPRLPIPLLRPESFETDPLVINIANVEQVILKKIQQKLNDDQTTTEIPESDETTTLVNDD